MWSYAQVTCANVAGGTSGARCKNPADAKNQPAEPDENLKIKSKNKEEKEIIEKNLTTSNLMSKKKEYDGTGNNKNSR